MSNEILPGYSSDATDQDENEDALQPPEAKRRMKGLKYEYICTVDTLEQAKNTIKSMDKTVWAPVSKFESSEGTRFYYKCNKALCKMRVYIHCTSITAEYCIYRSEGQHEHVISSTNRGVTQQQKDEIIRLYESGVTFPKNIAAQLKSM